ncbi:MAG: DNA polymerase III subunit gamma and tau [Propionibacteriaceae bacterium]|jgi:DNA polymerase-3 subunit gamma/tau|nr:DNA polymerase III subunit gamma and tau [Propionibacteriaceae bacterium]
MDDQRDDQTPEDDYFVQDGPGLFDSSATVGEALPVASGLNNQAANQPANDEPLALYRRYRPQTFAEVIGQDQVTEPLQRALTRNRVNHAYLFSGPRGCGKTSSARILARSLNCEQGPTPTPCGVCQSCRDLGRGGPGSIDVIEMDAASHGGVDDARDLRERAFFAPVQSRFKIYIVDEAHQVTPQGFNALLKLVEEPPPHVKFIFATTEPEKVLGTIRSRTHHYPFRLVPPRIMTDFLADICRQEGVGVEAGVLPMVVRAGAGSVRDSLSILDQLLGGAADDGVAYHQAASLLGFTPDALLDSIVDALGASDAAGVFGALDQVIEAGQDPRRFTEDLLARIRDLVIMSAVPDAASSGLIEAAPDQLERLAIEARSMGVAGLTRAAEVLAAGLNSLRGTTAPRLQLELICARLLLPSADAGDRGMLARIERLERRLEISDGAVVRPLPLAGPVADGPIRQASSTPIVPTATGPVAHHITAVPTEPASSQSPGATGDDPQMARAQSTSITSVEPNVERRLETVGSRTGAAPAQAVTTPEGGPSSLTPSSPPVGAGGSSPAAPPVAGGIPPASPQAGSPVTPQTGSPVGAAATPPGVPQIGSPVGGTSSSGAVDLERLRRSWPQLLKRVAQQGRYVWLMLNQHANLSALQDDTLWLTFGQAGAREAFNNKDGESLVAEAINQELGLRLKVRSRLATDLPPSGVALAPAPAMASPSATSPTPANGRSSNTGTSSAAPSGMTPLGNLAPGAAITSAAAMQSADGATAASPAGATPGAGEAATAAVETDPAAVVAQKRPKTSTSSVEASTTPPAARRGRQTSSRSSKGSAVDPADMPSEDDIVISNPGDQAEELLKEILQAELLTDEPTKPNRSRN